MNSSDTFYLGGHRGFDKVVWEVAEYKQGESPSITFNYHSHDGEQGTLSHTHPATHTHTHVCHLLYKLEFLYVVFWMGHYKILQI